MTNVKLGFFMDLVQRLLATDGVATPCGNP